MKTAVKTWVATCLVATVAGCAPEDLEPEPEARPSPVVEVLSRVQPLSTDHTAADTLLNPGTVTGVAETGCTQPLNGTSPVLNLSAGTWSCTYTVDVPEGAYDLRFRTISGTGDADLYVQYESPPDTSYNCVSRSTYVPERCNFMAPLPGRYYVQIYAASAIQNTQFTGAYSTGQQCTWPLENGEIVEDVGASGGTTPCLYTLEVPEGATRASFVTRGPGTFDMYIGRDYVPNEDLNECMSRNDTSDESCFIENPQPGTYYLRPYADLGTAEVKVHASFCAGPIALSNGTAIDHLSGWEDEGSCLYTLEVPAGATNLRLSTSGGTGDAHLYVKAGAAPTETVNDCESTYNGNSERCFIEAPQAGTYYVRMYGNSDYSDLSLKGRYCNGPVPLAQGVPVEGIDAWSDTWACTHSLEVPTGVTRLEVTLSGSDGGTLYIKHGSEPEMSTYDCKSSGHGDLESCVIVNPAAGTWYIRPRAYYASGFSGATLKATYTTNPAAGCTTTQPLSNGVPVGNIGAPAEGWSCLYTLNVPYGSTDVVISTSGGTGNADLFVEQGAEPGSAADCISAGPGNTETCTFRYPGLGKYYVRLYGQSAFSGVSLKATFTPPLPQACTTIVPLSNGTSVGGVAAPIEGWSCIYTLVVPAGAQQLEFTTTGGTGDGDLFVKFGATPSQSVYDCKSTSGTNAERCVISQPRAGTYHVRMYGYKAFSGVSLKGSFATGPSSCTSVIPLSSGVAVRNISVAQGAWSCVYSLSVPSDTGVAFVTSGGTGDVDMYVRYGATPTTSEKDCVSLGEGNSEQCIIYPPAQAGTWYVRLKGHTAAEGISLTGTR